MAAHHDEPTPLAGMPDVLPASQYLQDRLNQRRARNTRPKRSRHTDFGPQKGRDDDIFLTEARENARGPMFESSPVVASSRASDAGSVGRRRTLGLKDMDNQMDQLSKQNFDLKMELDHRRQQTQKMQQQIADMADLVERAQLVEDEHKELLRINSELVEELEKRDKAVEEAMDIICDLEDRVAELVDRDNHTRPSTAHADSGYAGTETQEHAPPASPPELNPLPKTPHLRPAPQASAASQKLQGLLNGETPARSKREPAILSQQKQSTHALRHVYMANAQQLHPVKSFHSLLSRQETRTDDGDDVLNSPRLSVLSESSFPSIYSPKKQDSPGRYAWEDAGNEAAVDPALELQEHRRHDSIKRVSQWISADATPSKSNNLSTPLADATDDDHVAQDEHYRSLSDALVSATTEYPDLLHDPLASTHSTRKDKPRPAQKQQQPRPMAFAGPIFGEAMLPPTPDSASTRMLRASRSSNIADERSLLDITPAPIKQEALVRAPEPGLRTAPRQMRSSVELRNALDSNLNYRSLNFDGQGPDHAEHAYHADHDDHDFDARSEIVKDISLDYDGFPDGNSIMMGTPSRFLKHARSPLGEMIYGANETSSISTVQSPQLRRRRSSEQIVTSPPKPRMSRVETSPTLFGSLGRIVSGGKKTLSARVSDESVTSPHSIHSGTSSNRTIMATEQIPEMTEVNRDRSRLTAVTSPTRHRASPSPGRRLSQKTAGLFRRLSSSQTERPPLPTLTTAPSSTFANSAGSELKRPMTSHSTERPSKPSTAVPRPPSARETSRPSLQTRTKTEPGTERPASAAATPFDKERKSIFTRSNSVKKSTEAECEMGRGLSKRRGSLRDAVSVSTRRPWR